MQNEIAASLDAYNMRMPFFNPEFTHYLFLAKYSAVDITLCNKRDLVR